MLRQLQPSGQGALLVCRDWGGNPHDDDEEVEKVGREAVLQPKEDRGQGSVVKMADEIEPCLSQDDYVDIARSMHIARAAANGSAATSSTPAHLHLRRQTIPSPAGNQRARDRWARQRVEALDRRYRADAGADLVETQQHIRSPQTATHGTRQSREARERSARWPHGARMVMPAALTVMKRLKTVNRKRCGSRKM
ncbi:hypothetical protein MY11210_004597 [Beauveria gryllotalpidicola]